MSDATDIQTFIASDYATAHLDTGLLRGRLDAKPSTMGLTVHRDGPDIALSAGTRCRDDDDVHVYLSIGPDQARELATVLEEVADAAEDSERKLRNSNARVEDKQQSLIERLLP